MVLLMIGTGELLLISLLALLLFGGKKLPELMRGLGSGVKNFKDGMNGIVNPEEKPSEIKSEVVDGETETVENQTAIIDDKSIRSDIKAESVTVEAHSCDGAK